MTLDEIKTRVRIDRTGQRYGRLTVLGLAGKDRFGKARWHCACDCGKRTVGDGYNLGSGHTTSCGCHVRERATTHGLSKSPEFKTWAAAKQRCTNPRDRAYPDYGGRGIVMSDRWMSFDNFLSDMGRRPSAGYSLERIDNDGPYSRENCRWATQTEQMRNTRATRWVTAFGIRLSLAEWCEKIGVNKGTLRGRLKSWSPERAVLASLYTAGV
jgi:hypothetical protein